MSENPEPTPRNIALLIGGGLSLLAALAHITIIIGGPEWYRFFGAGEEMAQMAERGEITPALITLFIACVLAGWAAYAFSAAGLIRKLPFMRFCLSAITLVYLVRAIGGLAAVILMENPYLTDVREQVTFMIISSLIVLVYGLIYAIGTAQAWPQLSPKKAEETEQ